MIRKTDRYYFENVWRDLHSDPFGLGEYLGRELVRRVLPHAGKGKRQSWSNDPWLHHVEELDHAGVTISPAFRGWDAESDLAKWIEVFEAETHDAPRSLTEQPGTGRTLWYFACQFYFSDAGSNPRDVEALLRARQHKQNLQLARARQIVEQPSQASPGREPISDDVKMFVWQRDGGHCVRCGSNELLEFDHIIPVVMGGANTARNLQILCEPCNRAKGGSLV